MKNFLEVLFADDDTNFLNGSVELVEVHESFVMNIEELEALGKECFLTLLRRAFLHDLCFQFLLETTSA